MRTSRFVLAASLAVSAVLAAASVIVREEEGAGLPAPSSGRLLDVDSALLDRPREVAILGEAYLDEVVDVDVAGDTAYVLGRSQWYAASGTHVRGPFGTSRPGAPGYIGAGEQIVVDRAGVFVLDRSGSTITRWSRTGEPVGKFSLPIGDVVVLHEFVVDAAGLPVALGQRLTTDGTAELVVLRLRGTRAAADTILVLPPARSLFALPRLAEQDTLLVLGDPFDHTLRWFSPDGTPERVHVRREGPIWITPDSMKRRFAARVRPLSSSSPTALALPDTLPSLRLLSVTASDRIIFGLDPGGGAVAFELFESDGSAVGMLPLPDTIDRAFATAEGIVWLMERPTTTTVLLAPVK